VVVQSVAVVSDGVLGVLGVRGFVVQGLDYGSAGLEPCCVGCGVLCFGLGFVVWRGDWERRRGSIGCVDGAGEVEGECSMACSCFEDLYFLVVGAWDCRVEVQQIDYRGSILGIYLLALATASAGGRGTRRTGVTILGVKFVYCPNVGSVIRYAFPFFVETVSRRRLPMMWLWKMRSCESLTSSRGIRGGVRMGLDSRLFVRVNRTISFSGPELATVLSRQELLANTFNNAIGKQPAGTCCTPRPSSFTQRPSSKSAPESGA